jgi:hypothetical protein
VLLEDKRPGFAMRPSPDQTPLLNTATTSVLAVDDIPPDNSYNSFGAKPVLLLKLCIRSVHRIVSSHELYLGSKEGTSKSRRHILVGLHLKLHFLEHPGKQESKNKKSRAEPESNR